MVISVLCVRKNFQSEGRRMMRVNTSSSHPDNFAAIVLRKELSKGKSRWISTASKKNTA